jgi:hypothetical protein
MSGEDADDADYNMGYLWEEGNYSCDCNRSLFLWNFVDAKKLECDLGENRIELVELEPKDDRTPHHQIWTAVSQKEAREGFA